MALDIQALRESHHETAPMTQHLKISAERGWGCGRRGVSVCGPKSSYPVNLRSRTLVLVWLAVIPRPAAVFTPAAEVPLRLAAPTLGAVRASHSTVVHLH